MGSHDGVTYRTALWQVGDSPEQNGSYNMASVVRKRKIVIDKEKYMCDRPTIEPPRDHQHHQFCMVQVVWQGWVK